MPLLLNFLDASTLSLQLILIIYKTHDTDGTGHIVNVDSKIKVRDQIMYFLVNASPLKLLDVATSSLQLLLI